MYHHTTTLHINSASRRGLRACARPRHGVSKKPDMSAKATTTSRGDYPSLARLEGRVASTTGRPSRPQRMPQKTRCSIVHVRDDDDSIIPVYVRDDGTVTRDIPENAEDEVVDDRDTESDTSGTPDDDSDDFDDFDVMYGEISDASSADDSDEEDDVWSDHSPPTRAGPVSGRKRKLEDDDDDDDDDDEDDGNWSPREDDDETSSGDEEDEEDEDAPTSDEEDEASATEPDEEDEEDYETDGAWKPGAAKRRRKA